MGREHAPAAAAAAAAAGPTSERDQNIRAAACAACLPVKRTLGAAMRHYTATPSHEGSCTPCCQVCVFFLTAFLLVAERTARESYPGHTHAHTGACTYAAGTHTHTRARIKCVSAESLSAFYLCDECMSVGAQCRCLLTDFVVCACARGLQLLPSSKSDMSLFSAVNVASSRVRARVVLSLHTTADSSCASRCWMPLYFSALLGWADPGLGPSLPLRSAAERDQVRCIGGG